MEMGLPLCNVFKGLTMCIKQENHVTIEKEGVDFRDNIHFWIADNDVG